MAERNWTKDQLSAIESTGNDILVSAAAGSGKTAVLTERIIRKLLDSNSPVDITDFLIVTFTVSATNELREKLSTAIRKTYNKDRSLKRLKRQILNLPSAKILTIDSFCKYIVKECAKQLNIPSDFQTGEENELRQMVNETVSETLDAYFDGLITEKIYDTSYLPQGIKSGFISVVQTFSTQKTFSQLNETVINLYNKLLKYPEPELLAKAYLSEYDKMLKGYYLSDRTTSFFDSVPGKMITEEIYEGINVALKYFEQAEEIISDCEEMSAKYAPIIQDDIAVATRLYSSSEKDLISSLATYSPIRLAVYKAKNEFEKDKQEKFKSLREAGKDLIVELKKKYPISDDSMLFHHIANTFSIANELFSVVLEFKKRLDEKKFQRKTYSFDDIAQFAYKALIKEGTYDKVHRTFEKTDYAKELSEKFNEIFIDEYQDVNELQDVIFRAVSNSHNRFMVGDLKQSIYKFRGATPKIFFEYRNTFKPVIEEGDFPKLVALQNNFRSDKSIIETVNTIFSSIMNYRSNDVYRESDHLVYSDIPQKTDQQVPVEISLFEDDSEFDYVADKILDLVSNNGYNFDDVCVLAKKNDTLKDIQEILSERGIPTDYMPNDDFFASYEIQTIYSLLKAIDNPSDDVSLLSTLSSPIFAFSPTDILNFRKSSMKGHVYFSLRDYNGSNELLKKKCQNVIEKLNYWRNRSKTVQSHTLIWCIYDETKLLSLIKKLDNGDERKENLLTFFDIASKYEQKEFKGITKLIAFLDSFKDGENKLKQKNSETNCVHLMTVHKSKGLEFPVCFFVSAHAQISRSDEKSTLVISDSFGPAFPIPTGNLGAKVTTYAEKAVIAETRANTIDEELRLLYVALTRPKNRLIITANANILSLKKSVELALVSTSAFAHSVKNATSTIKLLAIGLYGSTAFKNSLDQYDKANTSVTDDFLTVNLYSEYATKNTVNISTTESNECIIPIITASEISYASANISDEILSKTPYKISVSNMREGLLDEGAAASVVTAKKYPEFMSLDSGNISAFTGTAMHTFMQFCEFDNCTKHGTLEEAERLVKYKFITEEQKNVLNHTSLSSFFNSDTYKNIRRSKRIEREKRYTLQLPSSSFYSDSKTKQALNELGAKTLIQGVIDCYYVNDDGTITLIDFKTDNVNSENGEAVLRERHSKQMKMYKEAIQEIEGKQVSKALIYSFCLSKEIEI